MRPVAIVAGAVVWVLAGVAGAGALARANQRRGVRRIPAIERRIGRVYIAGAVLGPLSLILVAAVVGLFRSVDRADARAEERERARKLAARRSASEREDPKR